MSQTRRPPPLPSRRELPTPAGAERIEPGPEHRTVHHGVGNAAGNVGPTRLAPAAPMGPETTLVRKLVRPPALPKAAKLIVDCEELAVPPPPPREAVARKRRSTPPPTPAAAKTARTATPPALPTRASKAEELEKKVEASVARVVREESSETRAREAHELVEAAKSGDPRAFEALVKRYRHRIFALALHMTGSPSDADDITQDAFVRAYKNIERFEGRSEFFTWLYRIALNRALNVRRDRTRRRTQDLDDPRVTVAIAVDSGGDPHRAMELRQTYGYLVKAFDRLSPLLKTTVALTMMQGLSYPEAAVVLETTEGTIAWRIHESRKQMRLALETMMKDPTPVTALRGPDFERARVRKAPSPSESPRELVAAFESPPALEMALALLAPSV